MAKKKNIVVLTGAGISAESGIQTFRDAGGLWEGYDVQEVASPEGWRRNRALVLDFYNQRRRQLLTVKCNEAHKALVDLESQYEVCIITQNIDNLHEQAGSKRVVHLHGELLKARSTTDTSLIYDWTKDINVGDKCEKGGQLRPHIVWFGEDVPMIATAAALTSIADILIIIGTSMQVYPAAGLVHYAQPRTPIYFIDPKPSINENDYYDLTVVAEKATVGVRKVVDKLLTNT